MVEKVEDPKEDDKPLEPVIVDKPTTKDHEYSKNVKQIMKEGEEEQETEK